MGTECLYVVQVMGRRKCVVNEKKCVPLTSLKGSKALYVFNIWLLRVTSRIESALAPYSHRSEPHRLRYCTGNYSSEQTKSSALFERGTSIGIRPLRVGVRGRSILGRSAVRTPSPLSPRITSLLLVESEPTLMSSSQGQTTLNLRMDPCWVPPAADRVVGFDRSNSTRERARRGYKTPLHLYALQYRIDRTPPSRISRGSHSHTCASPRHKTHTPSISSPLQMRSVLSRDSHGAALCTQGTLLYKQATTRSSLSSDARDLQSHPMLLKSYKEEVARMRDLPRRLE